MALVSFTLSEEGVGAFNDALVCINKFSDDVALDIKKDKLILTALNLTKSAYVSFTFAANRFFSRFLFEGNAQYRERFYCGDPTRDRDNVTTIERCDVSIDDGPGKKSRFIAKIFCRNGITATHRLSFEAKAPVHAKFDKEEAIHHWTINPRTLRSLMEHFGPGIDLLDINTDGDNVVNFTCFTEKQASPLHTSIAVEMDEFDNIEVAEKLHIIISVRDFRAILQHANWTSSELNAAYSTPGRPMKIAYNGDGIICDFVLMTVDEKGTAAQKKGQNKAATKASRPALNAAPNTPAAEANDHVRQPNPSKEQQAQQASMPPPARRSVAPRSSQFDIRAPFAQPPSTLKSDSLFLPQPDEDEQWEPVNPDEDEEGENPRLEWGASNETNPSTMRMSNHFNTTGSNSLHDAETDMPSFLEPTQRVSDVRRFGLFGS
ncbi:hypothetical protein VPNG_00682 [Cytospora leucostoma]|uniref:DNA repair protein rad9 n=1 Tax=Cytospora leucostoma TaxID=1230097 RepID=A0A423XMD0_9PEZI|nr:hypothetical protein VPNG_00682 [Cytospora leucostoma]